MRVCVVIALIDSDVDCVFVAIFGEQLCRLLLMTTF